MERIRIATIYYCTSFNHGVAGVRNMEINDWSGEEITHSEHIYQYGNDLFDDDGAREYLNAIIDNMELSEVLELLRNLGMEDVTK